jgi:hypothetical protein
MKYFAANEEFCKLENPSEEQQLTVVANTPSMMYAGRVTEWIRD